MTTPAWVITGLLDSGKTTLINQLIDQELKGQDILVLQFEAGETPLTEQEHVKKLAFSKSQLEQLPFSIADTIFRSIEKHSPDFILVEWNGMEHFHKLEEMLLQFSAKAALRIEKVIYAAEEERLAARIVDAGETALSQIEGSDCAYIRQKGHWPNRSGLDALYRCNPDIQVYTSRNRKRLARALFHAGRRPQYWFLMLLAAAVLYWAVFSALSDAGAFPDRYISIFLGIFLQAAPFLAIGTLLSSLIQVYVRPDWIQRRFPRGLLTGQLFAVLAGFCLPVCDCASIPVFKSLVKKGVPIPAAVTFMLASPVINPVVILSTWYAFNGNYKILAARCGLGVLCAVLCGMTYLFKPPKDYLIEHPMPIQPACGDYSLPVKTDARLVRFSRMMRHAQNEFFSVGKFLLAGIFISTLFQDTIPQAVAAGGAAAPWKALLVMMGLAFVLSLCSSSDAVVARSMAGSLPAGAVLGFLVFGPMMDSKNAAMLLSGFRYGFVVRLFVTTFLICFFVIGLFMIGGSGGIKI